MVIIIDNPRKNFIMKNNIIFIEIQIEINKLDILILIHKTLLWWWETCNFWGNANKHNCTEWTKDANKNYLYYFIYNKPMSMLFNWY